MLVLAPPSADAVLHVDNISLRFGGVQALKGVSLELARGDTLGVIGPNGAGKTSLINVITGFERPSSGRILIDDQDITASRAWQRARGVLSRTYQSQRIFDGLTVRENLEVAIRSSRSGALSSGALLDLVGLSSRAADAAGALAHGDRCLLGVARALATEPSFLLLDEPVAGLDQQDLARLHTVLDRLRSEHRIGLLLVEHNIEFVFTFCPRILVLDRGAVLAVGDRQQVERNEDVIRAYIGSDDADSTDAVPA